VNPEWLQEKKQLWAVEEAYRLGLETGVARLLVSGEGHVLSWPFTISIDWTDEPLAPELWAYLEQLAAREFTPPAIEV
jgi:hypothetical protein